MTRNVSVFVICLRLPVYIKDGRTLIDHITQRNIDLLVKKFTTIYKFTTTEKDMNHANHTLSNLITNWTNAADV